MKIGAYLCFYRLSADVTLRKLAKQIGVSPATLSRIENGKPMDSGTMLKMIQWLFADSVEQSPTPTLAGKDNQNENG